MTRDRPADCTATSGRPCSRSSTTTATTLRRKAGGLDAAQLAHAAAAVRHDPRRDGQAPRAASRTGGSARSSMGDEHGRAVGVGRLGRRQRLGLAHRRGRHPRGALGAASTTVGRRLADRGHRRRRLSTQRRRAAAAARPASRSPCAGSCVHMIEEYARHNGHADLIRESIDGRTGGVTRSDDPPDDRGRTGRRSGRSSTRSSQAGETYAYPLDLTSEQARGALDDERRPARPSCSRRTGGSSAAPPWARTGPAAAATSAPRRSWSSGAARGRGVGRRAGGVRRAVAPRPGLPRRSSSTRSSRPTTAAVHLWESLGFGIVGTVPGAFDSAAARAVGLHVMYLPLD